MEPSFVVCLTDIYLKQRPIKKKKKKLIKNAIMALTPLVYWAQRHEEIYLRVELTDAQVRVHLAVTCHGQNALVWF